MKIYVASPWVNKEDARLTGVRLREKGFTVVSRWHDTTHKSNIYEAPEPVMQAEAKKDLEDIGNANALVYLNLGKSEGKATELGIAIVRCIPIYALGGKQGNVFLHLPQINHFASLEDLITELGEAE